MLAVTLSCTTTINVGVLSLALALLVGVFLGGMSVDAVLEGFPDGALRHARRRDAALRIAEMQRHARAADRRAPCASAAATRALLPIMFFALGFVVSTIGAGRHAGQRAAGAAGDGRRRRAPASRRC